MRKQSYIIIASAVLVVTLATTQFANAAGLTSTKVGSSLSGNQKHTAPIMGSVTAINASTLTITNKKGVVYTVDASSAEMYVGGSKTAATLSTIKVGDTIAVMGTVSGNTVTAKTILDGVDLEIQNKKKMANNHIPGKITAINGSIISIEVGGHGKNATTEDFTVSVTGTTTLKKNGQSATLADLAVGQMISVTGTIDTSAKTITATSINGIIPGTHTQLTGTVQSISGNTLVLLGKDKSTHTIDASSAKVVTGLNRNDQGTIAKIAVGDKIAVTGSPSTGGTTVIATIIRDMKK